MNLVILYTDGRSEVLRFETEAAAQLVAASMVAQEGDAIAWLDIEPEFNDIFE